jgi:predicted MFS family arabinose efflux permease
MPLLRDDLGISRTVGGLHFSAVAFGSVTTGLVVGRIVGTWGRNRVFWSGGGGVVAGSVLIGAGWHPAVTMLGALLIGMSGSAMLVVAQAVLSDHHSLHRPVALTEAATSMSVGTVLPAVLIGALVAVGAGWRNAFLAPVAIWIALALLLRAETFPSAPPIESRKHRRVLPGTYWWFWAAFIPAVGAEWSVGAWGADYLVEVAGTSEGSASFLMSAFFGAMVLGRLIGSKIAGVVSPFMLLLGASAVGLGGTLLFWVSDALVPVVAGLFVGGLGISMLFPMLLSQGIGIAPGHADIAAARVSIAAGGSVLVSPLTLGVIADQVGIRDAFAMVPVLLVLVAALAAIGHQMEAARRPRRSFPYGAVE